MFKTHIKQIKKSKYMYVNKVYIRFHTDVVYIIFLMLK